MGKFGGWGKEVEEAVEMGFTARDCSPMNMKRPVRTEVGVRPSMCWKGGERKRGVPPAWREGDQCCS